MLVLIGKTYFLLLGTIYARGELTVQLIELHEAEG